MEDAVINLEFEDDPTLIVRYSYSLYPDTQVGFRHRSDQFETSLGSEEGTPGTPVRCRYLNVTFGRYPPHVTMGNLDNCSVYVLCNNNANFTDVTWNFNADANSTVFFGFDNDTTIADGRFYCGLEAGLVYLIVNIPSGATADVALYSPRRNVWAWDGWIRDGEHYITTEAQTNFDIVVTADVVHAWLYL